MLTQQQATKFAEEWLAAWNAHDLDAVMSHYADDLEFTSPFIVSLTGDAMGTIRNKKDLKGYFEHALQKFTDLHFDLYAVLTGVQSVVLYYKSVDEMMAAELMQLNDSGKITMVKAHYLPNR